MLRNFIKKKLLQRGIILSRPPGQFSITHYKLDQARRRGLDVKFAVDGGAATGKWTADLKSIFPRAKVLMIEPRDDCQSQLAQLKSTLPDLEIRQTLLGSAQRTVVFYESEDQSTALAGMASSGAKQLTKPMQTLDALVRELSWGWPDLIKLDLQGYELEALAGAQECLARAQVLLLEVNLLEFEPGMPLIADVIAYLRQFNFVAYDIFSLLHRPLDGALAQGDFLFLRADHPLRADRRFQA